MIPGLVRGRLRLPPPSRRHAGRRGAARSAAALGEDDYDLEWIEAVGGTRSPLAHAALGRDRVRSSPPTIPAPRVVPVVSPGFTDSHFLREAFGTVAYGFFPMRTMDPELAARLIHSADERIAVDDLELGTRFLVHVAAYTGTVSDRTPSGWEEWPSRTACSCTGRATGRARSAPRTAS